MMAQMARDIKQKSEKKNSQVENKKISMNTELSELNYKIKGAFYEVYKQLGPGLLEKVYEVALERELTIRGLRVERQAPVSIRYKGEEIASEMRLDMLVEDKVIVELKSVESGLQPIHFKQLRTYLRLMDKPCGWLVNFDEEDICDGIRPVTNYLYGYIRK